MENIQLLDRSSGRMINRYSVTILTPHGSIYDARRYVSRIPFARILEGVMVDPVDGIRGLLGHVTAPGVVQITCIADLLLSTDSGQSY